MKSILTTLFFLLVACPVIYAQESNSVPFDPEVRSGILENGMTYYIRHNEEPDDRASFYFAQNVGSILEKKDQRGLAHFLEHMAFNGTKHYKGKAMLEYLEKNGIKFGAEINAFTSFDKTVYNISSVPTTKPQLIDSVLLVLHDWSGYISLLDSEIDKERGVINEEWRTRNTAGYRASEKIWKQGILKGSKYAKRMPIGLMSVVNNFTYDELRDYYHRWYRPDLQAVIVVGDIDVDQMEAKIKSIFSAIPLKDNLPERSTFNIPSQKDDFIFVEALDKELGNINVTYYFKNDIPELKGVDYLRNNLVKSLVSYVFRNRMEALTFDKTCPALSVRYSCGKFVRPLEIVSLSVQPKKKKIKEAFQFALTEFLRYAQYGATDAELKRAKISIKNSYISYLKNEKNISNESYARQLYAYFFTGNPLPALEWKVKYISKTLPTITNEDLMTFLTKRIDSKDRVLAVKGNSEATFPDEKTFAGVIQKVESDKLTKYVEKVSNQKLINKSLTGSKVKSTFDVPGTDAKGYVLGNGAKVVIYPTDLEDDRIYLNAFSNGGRSLIAADKLPSAGAATSLAAQSGLGTLNKIALDKKLAGTNTSLRLSINSTSETLNGRSTKKDIEILLKRVYLSFEAPRFDETAFHLMIDQMKKGLKRKQQNIKSEWRDSLSLARTNHSNRTWLFNANYIKSVDFNKAATIYKKRFSNVNDFTFVFVGDIEEGKLLKLIEKYIGSIASTSGTEEYVNHHLNPAKGKTVVALREKMETPQTTVRIAFSGKMQYSPKNKLVMNVLGELLGKRYLKVIREEEGGSYGVGASAGLGKIPEEEFYLNVGFNCNPEMADKLIQVVYDEVVRLQKVVNEADLHEIKQAFIKNKEERQEENGYWLNAISAYLRKDTKILSTEEYRSLVNKITTDDIKQAAQIILEKADIVEGVLNPEMSME